MHYIFGLLIFLYLLIYHTILVLPFIVLFFVGRWAYYKITGQKTQKQLKDEKEAEKKRKHDERMSNLLPTLDN
jgi:hypothetical protein